MPISSSVSTVRWRNSLARSATVSSKYEPVSSGRGPPGASGSPLEVEPLELGRGVEREAGAARLLERAAQHLAGVAFERRAVEVDDVAEHAGDRGVVAQRQDLERARVGLGQHVGFLHAGEAVDRRSVEGHALFEGVFQLGGRDVERLGGAEHVGEPQLDESDAALFDGSEDVVLLALHVTVWPIGAPATVQPMQQRSQSVHTSEAVK